MRNSFSGLVLDVAGTCGSVTTLLRKRAGARVFQGKTIGIAVVVLFVLVGQSLAATDYLTKARAVYEKTVVEYQAEYDASMKAWPGKCLGAMKRKRTWLQKSGDLDGWTAAEKVIAHFVETRDITDADVQSAPAGFGPLLQRCLDKKRSYEELRNRQIIDIHDKYVASLTAYQEKLTRAAKMNEAYAVKDELGRAATNPAVTAARFAMDVQDVENAVNVVPPQPEPSPAQVQAPAQQWPITLNDGTVIYEPGTSPERDKALVMKRSAMSRTGNVSIGAPVSVTAWEGSRNKSSRDSQSSYHESRTQSETCFLRLMLRPRQSGVVLTNLYVVAEYFVQAVSSSSTSKHVDARRAASRTIPLAQLSRLEQYIDVAPIRVGVSTRSYGSSYSSKSGDRYYGSTVSVYSGNGELLCQVASRPHLRETASDKSPDFELSIAVEIAARARARYDAARRAYYSSMGNEALEAAYKQAREERYAADMKVSELRRARNAVGF